eukprot:GHVT01035168.1.p2 GENE.GHVT01035168.1~~GHVT01035168.1.p2  ORF type:complete len:139 (+),score=24.64 GHVT01035168.1:1099-1515(+)
MWLSLHSPVALAVLLLVVPAQAEVWNGVPSMQISAFSNFPSDGGASGPPVEGAGKLSEWQQPAIGTPAPPPDANQNPYNFSGFPNNQAPPSGGSAAAPNPNMQTGIQQPPQMKPNEMAPVFKTKRGSKLWGKFYYRGV